MNIVALGAEQADALVTFFSRLPNEDLTLMREDVTEPDIVRGWADRPAHWVALDGDAVVGFAAVRPLPSWSGNRNFCIPSDTNTAPTITRISTVAVGALVVASRRSMGVPSHLRRELCEVVDTEALLDSGDAVDHLIEPILAEQLVFLLFEVLAERGELVL